MAEVVNLRQHRKRKAREEQDASAARNRAAFGRTKSERQTAEREGAQAAKRLEGHRLPRSGREDDVP